jgi:hypothetical protein
MASHDEKTQKAEIGTEKFYAEEILLSIWLLQPTRLGAGKAHIRSARSD